MLDTLGAMAVLALDLPYALLDQGVSAEHRAARLAVAILVSLAVLFTRRRLPLVLLGLAVLDVLLKYVSAFSLGWAAYAVARHQRRELVATLALVLAWVVCVKVWTWDSVDAAVLHVRSTALFLTLPAAVGFLVRGVSSTPPGGAVGDRPARLPRRRGEPERLPVGPERTAAPDLVAGLAELDAAAEHYRARGPDRG